MSGFQMLAAVFGLWDYVIPEDRRFGHEAQLSLPLRGPKKATARTPTRPDKTAGEKG
jgi:hypothetical protein